MRSVRAAVAAALLTLATAAGASAVDGTGRVDSVEAHRGEVTVLFSVPGLPEGVAPDPATVAVSLDGDDVGATAEPVTSSADAVRRDAVLAIDVSDSMRGAKFRAARQAALAYVDRAPEDVYVGLVAFADEVSTLVAPTRDRQSLREAIDGLTLAPQTSLYDALLTAIDLSGGGGQGSVLVLSDGKDTTTTPLSSVTRQARRSGVRVDAVSLEQNLGRGSPLARVTQLTGGTVTSTSDPRELEALFTRQADELANQLLIRFPEPSAGTTSGTLVVSVEAGGATFTDDAFVTLSGGAGGGERPRYSAPASGERVVGRPLMLSGVALLFVGLAILLAFTFTKLAPVPETPMQRQLALYTVQGLRRPETSHRPDSGAALRHSAVALTEGLINRRDFETSLSTKLDRAGLKLKAAEWVLLHAGIAIVAALLGLLLSGGAILPAAALLLVGALVPWLYLGFKESRRIKAFNAQLAPTLQIIAGALQAGLSLPQAVDTVVHESQEPVAGEFRRAIIEQRLGVEIEDSLETVAERMGSVDFHWVVMAIRIQREVGGNLAELLLTVAATLREREYLRRQVSVLSAEGRLSAWILGGLPPFFVLYLALARPTYLAPMLHTPVGWVLSGVACVMLGVGIVWLKIAVKVEV